jgi:hypothetical protein
LNLLSGRGENLGTREIAHISQHANVITILVFFSGFFDVLPGQHSRQDRMAHWTKLHTCVVQHHDTSTKRAETVKKHVSVQVSVHTPHLDEVMFTFMSPKVAISSCLIASSSSLACSALPDDLGKALFRSLTNEDFFVLAVFVSDVDRLAAILRGGLARPPRSLRRP